MRLNIMSLWLFAPTLASTLGCAATTGVRYVYQDGDYGVVGLPENSDRWPSYYRTRADKLMGEHFPDGHEIVRAEEVVEGSRVLKLEGTHTAEVSPSLTTVGMSVAKLGRSSSRTQADTTKITECRIIYRRSGGPDGSEGYAEAPGLTPTFYLDPNAAERLKADGHISRSNDLKTEPSLLLHPPCGDG